MINLFWKFFDVAIVNINQIYVFFVLRYFSQSNGLGLVPYRPERVAMFGKGIRWVIGELWTYGTANELVPIDINPKF